MCLVGCWSMIDAGTVATNRRSTAYKHRCSKQRKLRALELEACNRRSGMHVFRSHVAAAATEAGVVHNHVADNVGSDICEVFEESFNMIVASDSGNSNFPRNPSPKIVNLLAANDFGDEVFGNEALEAKNEVHGKGVEQDLGKAAQLQDVNGFPHASFGNEALGSEVLAASDEVFGNEAFEAKNEAPLICELVGCGFYVACAAAPPARVETHAAPEAAESAADSRGEAPTRVRGEVDFDRLVGLPAKKPNAGDGMMRATAPVTHAAAPATCVVAPCRGWTDTEMGYKDTSQPTIPADVEHKHLPDMDGNEDGFWASMWGF